MPQSRLGPLAMESKLGDHPSQSSVWRAIHVQLQRAIAVKVFASPFGCTPEARAGFIKEWEQLKSLSHPALAKCFGGGFENTDAYLAYELVEGETLAAQLQQRNRLPWEAVLDLGETLAGALEYLHENGIVFGNLHPDKILFAGLSPVLVDVRLDRAGSPFRSPQPPSPDQLVFCPPEWIDDPAAASVRTDLYQLGAIMYQSVTGRAPIHGDTIEEVTQNIHTADPLTPSSIVMECPVWLDKLIMQMLSKDSLARPASAAAVKLAMAEVRRRAMSRSGVAEHASSGFSPLSVTDQQDREVARKLLGRDELSFDDEQPPKSTAWHDLPIVLIGALVLVAAIVVYLMWPLNEDQMRQRAERLLENQTRSSMVQAKNSFLKPMIDRFPDGKHVNWAHEEIERIEMLQAEHALEVKIKRNLPLRDEAERLYVEANKFERFGDTSTALDQYRSMVTLLSDDPDYRPFVNLARRQIGVIESEGIASDEASLMIQKKLDQADQLFASGKVIGARKIWYSVVELYGRNAKVAPLVSVAQERLAPSLAPQPVSTP